MFRRKRERIRKYRDELNRCQLVLSREWTVLKRRAELGMTFASDKTRLREIEYEQDMLMRAEFWLPIER